MCGLYAPLKANRREKEREVKAKTGRPLASVDVGADAKTRG